MKTVGFLIASFLFCAGAFFSSKEVPSILLDHWSEYFSQLDGNMNGKVDLNDVSDCEHALVTYFGVTREHAQTTCPKVLSWFERCVLEGKSPVSKAKFLARWSLYYKMDTLNSKVSNCMDESWPLFDWNRDGNITSSEREIPPALNVQSVSVPQMIAYWKEYLLDETSTLDLSLPPLPTKK